MVTFQYLATVSGVTVTNAGTYRAQSVSAPSRVGQLSPTGTCWQCLNDAEYGRDTNFRYRQK